MKYINPADVFKNVCTEILKSSLLYIPEWYDTRCYLEYPRAQLAQWIIP